MKQLTFCFVLALIFLASCSKEVPIASDNLSIQASTMAYDPSSVQSVVLNSHSIYGPMIMNHGDVDLPASQGGGVVWLGPWVDGDGPYNRPDLIGFCRGQDKLCYIIIDASSAVADIFQSEGLNIGNFNQPVVVIRTYLTHSNILLVDNFSDDPITGMHSGNVIKALQ